MIFILLGILLLAGGGWFAWHALKQNIMFASGGIAFLGIILIIIGSIQLVINKKHTGISNQPHEIATEHQKSVETDTPKKDKNETKNTETHTPKKEEKQPTQTKVEKISNSHYEIYKTIDTTDENKQKAEHKSGPIDLLGMIYHQNGEQKTTLYAEQKFQIIVNVPNATHFFWDVDADYDSDWDGITTNDRDAEGAKPELMYKKPGKYKLLLRATNDTDVYETSFSVEIKEAVPLVILNAKQIPETLEIEVDGTASILRSEGTAKYEWLVNGLPTKLKNPNKNNSKGIIELVNAGNTLISLKVTATSEDPKTKNIRNISNTASKQLEIKNVLIASIQTDKNIVEKNETITFIADGNGDTFEWDFDDDTKTITVRTIIKSFSKSGAYQITLTTKQNNQQKTAQKTIYVKNGNKPIPVITANQKTGDNTTTFTFSAAESKDNSGTSDLSYTWDLGDNTEIKQGKQISHKFAKPGNYQITLTTADIFGENIGEYERKIITINIIDAAPTASFTFETIENNIAIFDASASTDNDIANLEYFWDFGDGQKASSKKPKISHVYTDTGIFTTELTVKDSANQTNTLKSDIEILK